ncbi:MAG TPA: glycosyltransferase family 39 protein, partial [Candidatus Kapabacteria bacterium]|nr:glycosyltransferase family 39 protein [Candidatus Kapabacteria bacterium]
MKLSRISSLLALVTALGVMLFVALSRLSYPFELEWMESMTLRTVQWLVLGRTIYPAPSMEFVAYPYTPLFFYTSYLAADVVGVGFAPMRLTSLVASLVSFWYLFRMLRSTLDDRAAMFGTALYVASYSLSGYWFDVARVDAMFMSLSIAGTFHFLRHTTRDYLIAALLFALAAFTKQTALLIALPLCVYALIKYRAKSLWFSLPLGVLVLSAIAIFHFATDGWFTYYSFGFMRNQIYKDGYVPHLLWHDLAKPLPILFLMSCAGLWLLIKKRMSELPLDLLITVLAYVAAALYVDSHMASFKNDLMPMYLGLAVIFAVLIDRISLAYPRYAMWTAIAATLQVLMILPGFQHQIPTE